MKPLIAIIGPTASGKSALGVELALFLNGEVISADSMLVYKYMDIGTAKPTMEERRGVRHHMIDLITPDTPYSVYEYQQQAFLNIKDIANRGMIPLVVGGTGLYVQSVLDGYEFGPVNVNLRFRQGLQKIADGGKAEVLHRALEKIDPASAEKIHPNDVRRTIRALEVYKGTGVPISSLMRRPSYLSEQGYRVHRIGLTLDRDVLYQRIDDRVDKMIASGLVDEVQYLHRNKYNLTHYSMQSLGYKQISLYIEGKLSFQNAVDDIKKETRRFAKRQFTWFKRDNKVRWITLNPSDSLQNLSANVCEMIKDI